MSRKVVTIIGVTGAQGGSVLETLLKDSSYSIRAITRTPNSEAGKYLTARGVQVVQADLNDLNSLIKAFEGTYAIYAVTDFFEPFGKYGAGKALEIESTQGINLAKAAAATVGLQQYIWSTLPDGANISGGKYIVPHFASKNRADRYIRSQPELLTKTTFFWVTFYAQNYYFPMFTPIHVPTAGKYIQVGITSPYAPIKTIGDARVNIGAFVKAILEQPERTSGGKIVIAHVSDTTTDGMLQSWARARGKIAQYVQVDESPYNAIWPGWAEEVGVMMQLWEEVRERSWTGEGEILSKEELGVTGLIGLEESFAGLDF